MFLAIQNVRSQMAKSLRFQSGKLKISSANFKGTEIMRCYSSALCPRTNVFTKYRSEVTVPIRFVSHESTTVLHSVYSDSRPVLYVQDLFQSIHDVSGLSWWSTIVLTIIGLRLFVTFPLAVYQHYVLAKYERLGPEIEALAKDLMMETKLAARKYNLDEKRAKYIFNVNLKQHTKKLIIRDNCHPFKASLLIYVQLPLWFSQSLSLRNMVYMLPVDNMAARLTCMQFSFGGILWFSNLTCPDTTWILPILMGIVNLSIIEFNVLRLVRPPGKLQRWLTNGFRVLTVVMVPIAASVPVCLTISWLTSSIFGLVQNIVLHQPKVRRFCRIPKTPTESETPLRDVFEKLKKKFKVGQ